MRDSRSGWPHPFAPLANGWARSNGRSWCPIESQRLTVQVWLCAWYKQSASPAHHSPVVFISGSTSQTNLIMPAIFVEARPREAVRATLAEKQLQQVHGFT